MRNGFLWASLLAFAHSTGLFAPAVAFADVVTIDIAGSGTGLLISKDPADRFRTRDNAVIGNVSFDTSGARPFGTGLRIEQDFSPPFPGFVSQLSVFLLGNEIVFESTVRSANLQFRDTFNFSLLFREGFLNNAFPTSATTADIISGTFFAQTTDAQISGSVSSSSRGVIQFVNLQTQPGSAGGTVNFRVVQAIPEPMTWSFMLVGFGAVGCAMRSARYSNRKPRLLS